MLEFMRLSSYNYCVRKFLPYFSMLFILLIFASCRKTPDRICTIGYSYSGGKSGHSYECMQKIRKTYSSKDGYMLYFDDCMQNIDAQKKSIAQFILNRCDFIIIDPLCENGYDSVLQRAELYGIPLIFVNGTVNFSAKNTIHTSIFPDYAEEGKKSVNVFETYARVNKAKVSKLNYCILNSFSNSTRCIRRTEGILEQSSKLPLWNFCSKYETGDSYEKSREIMNRILLGKTQVSLVFVSGENALDGVIDACREKNLTLGKNIYVISFDAYEHVLEKYCNGEVFCIAKENDVCAEAVSHTISSVKSGYSMHSQKLFKTEMFYYSNSDEYFVSLD